jgi:hypothetical protein
MVAVALALAIVAIGTSGFAALLAVGAVLRVRHVEQSGRTPTVRALEPGAEAPTDLLSIHLETPSAELRLGSQFLVFISPACEPCGDIVKVLNTAWTPEHSADTLLVIEVAGRGETSLRGVATFDAPWIRDTEGDLAAAFGVPGFPFAFRVAHGRVVEAGMARPMLAAALGGLYWDSEPVVAGSPR